MLGPQSRIAAVPAVTATAVPSRARPDRAAGKSSEPNVVWIQPIACPAQPVAGSGIAEAGPGAATSGSESR